MTPHIGLADLVASHGVAPAPVSPELVVDPLLCDYVGSVAPTHSGDLRVDGDLRITGGVLVVNGDLAVTGGVSTDESGTLVVTGDLSCHHLYLEGNLEVRGALTVHSVLFGFYEAGISRVHGTACARIALIGDHDWECDDEEFRIQARFSSYHKLENGVPELLLHVLGERTYRGLTSLMALPPLSNSTEGEESDSDDVWGLSLFAHL